MTTVLFHSPYVLFVSLALLIALRPRVTGHIREPKLRRHYYLLQGVTLIGAVFGAKLSVLIGDYHWPWTPLTDWNSVLRSGRSITGALIFGFLFAELAKPLLRYPMPPNDRFAAMLPFSVAIGRIGCLLGGCCQGIPYTGWCAMRGADGVLRHPAPLYEIAFQAIVGVIFIFMAKREWLFGRLFSLYLVIYGVFRFLTEFVRDTPKFFHGLSGYQVLALAMIVIGGIFLIKRTIAPPPGWNRFRLLSNSTTPISEVSHV